jgi:hypothetical protein
MAPAPTGVCEEHSATPPGLCAHCSAYKEGNEWPRVTMNWGPQLLGSRDEISCSVVIFGCFQYPLSFLYT